MASKKTGYTAGQRGIVRTELEKNLLKLMIDYDVDQTDLASFEGITPQAINNRLKRLNQEKYQDFIRLIKIVAETRK